MSQVQLPQTFQFSRCSGHFVTILLCSPRILTTSDSIILSSASNDSQGSPQPSLRILRSNGSTSSAAAPEGSQERHTVPLTFPPLCDKFLCSLDVSGASFSSSHAVSKESQVRLSQNFSDVLGPFSCLSLKPIEPDLVSPVIIAKSNPPLFAACSPK